MLCKMSWSVASKVFCGVLLRTGQEKILGSKKVGEKCAQSVQKFDFCHFHTEIVKFGLILTNFIILGANWDQDNNLGANLPCPHGTTSGLPLVLVVTQNMLRVSDDN